MGETLKKATDQLLSMPRADAMSWLWGAALLNLGLGGLIWFWNAVVAEGNNSMFEPGIEADALAGQALGAGLFGFGAAVLVLTLATTAIVDAISNPKAQS